MTSMLSIAHRDGIDAKKEIKKGNWQLRRYFESKDMYYTDDSNIYET